MVNAMPPRRLEGFEGCERVLPIIVSYRLAGRAGVQCRLTGSGGCDRCASKAREIAVIAAPAFRSV
jgi:hypothetical protein